MKAKLQKIGSFEMVVNAIIGNSSASSMSSENKKPSLIKDGIKTRPSRPSYKSKLSGKSSKRAKSVNELGPDVIIPDKDPSDLQKPVLLPESKKISENMKASTPEKPSDKESRTLTKVASESQLPQKESSEALPKQSRNDSQSLIPSQELADVPQSLEEVNADRNVQS